MGFKIAIDGPVGSGKSSVAKALSRRLGYIYIDTGAMYRAVGYNMLCLGIDLAERGKIISRLGETDIKIRHVDGEQRIFLNGSDVTQMIRSQAVSNAASKVAAYPEVREKLVALQRQLAKEENIVMDGRDIGSFVLPDAELKIYLDADPKVRAGRRFDQLAPFDPSLCFENVLKETIERDKYDMGREHSPLIKADDAFVILTDELTLDEVVELIYNKAESRGA